MPNALVIPELPTTAIAPGWNQDVKRVIAKIADIESVEEYRRQIAALYAYRTNREEREELEAAARWCEIRIGELLGKGLRGQPGQKAAKSNSIAIELEKSSSSQFRLLAENKPLIAPLIESGVSSRSQLLAEIKKLKRKAKRQQEREDLPRGDIPDGRCTLIIGESTKELSKLDSACARLIFADPPYNIGVNYGDGEKADLLPSPEYVEWSAAWMRECHRLLTDDGSFWVMVGDEYAAEFAVSLKGIGFTIRNWIKWYEAFGVNCQNKFNRCSRHIFYCVKSADDFVFNPEPVSRPSDRQAVYNDRRASHHGKLFDDVWLIPRVTGTSKERIADFPTQLPLELLRCVVGCASNKDDLVIDPFNGSGTTGVACLELGRRYLGIDRSERWVTLARERLETITPAHDAA